MLDQLLEFFPDFGLETVSLLLVLVALEAVLSADNAIALAALVQGIPDLKYQQRALNFGLVAAFVLRITLILTATWVIKFWQFELAGAAYLLWLSFKYFSSPEDEQHHHHGLDINSIWQAIPLLAITDLAFSLDSVTTAIALSEERWIVLTGGVIGILVLRFMAELFIRLLKEFTHLQDAGYLTVTLVGLRLLLRVFDSQFVLPDWLMLSMIGLCFAWGFSQRNPPETITPGPDLSLNLGTVEPMAEDSQEPVSAGTTHKSTELN
ncbi:TerC family protein [Synechococcus sp. PCC 6312]|uniref:TerC family protein n=1 Tax=Synechococcus sp. (strain ATCC 27167 / PCC 6312) TaxID=195253 RepID=UPI00029F045F|nr:YkoY family integral membrane protein [Synechococcus sp. PCC 6312]AFY61498.1 integral membrane protein, YkoY family [Synechococcus sp. PCC 6312]